MKISFCMKFSWRASRTKNVGETHKNNRRKFTDTSVKCRILIADSSPKGRRHFFRYFTRRRFAENLPHCRRPIDAASAIIPSPSAKHPGQRGQAHLATGPGIKNGGLLTSPHSSCPDADLFSSLVASPNAVIISSRHHDVPAGHLRRYRIPQGG